VKAMDVAAALLRHRARSPCSCAKRVGHIHGFHIHGFL
jgi:hypothetical protein